MLFNLFFFVFFLLLQIISFIKIMKNIIIMEIWKNFICEDLIFLFRNDYKIFQNQ